MAKRIVLGSVLATCAILVCACSSDATQDGHLADAGNDGDATVEPTNGQVTPEWEAYCVATFSSDHSVDTGVGSELFRARAGDRYLMSGGGWLLYLTPDGPFPFQVDPAVLASPCSDAAVGYAAAFTDVTLYSSVELTTPLCELSAGTVALLDPSKGLGGNPQGQPDANNGVVYELTLNTLSQHCGGAETGFLYRPWTSPEGLNIHTYLLPEVSPHNVPRNSRMKTCS